MKEVTIEATSRPKAGKGVARKLRAAGKIPGVVYGKGEEPMAIELDHAHFHGVMRLGGGENLLINLKIDGRESDSKALIRDVQRDPVDGKLIHIDFQHISLTEKIRVSVPIVLEGIPDGVKNFGGIVNFMVRDVEVSCLPMDIPERIVLDISALGIHDSLHVKNIKLENVDILASPEETIVSVVPPTIIKEAAPAAVEGEVVAAAPIEGEETPAEPEVISEKKAEERKAEKAEREKEKGKGGKEKEKQS
jgi:large subunit ribosomal protein L25